MTPPEWAGFAAGICAVLTGFFVGLRYLIKGWLWTLTPNSGSSLADRLARIETRQEEMMRILVDRKQPLTMATTRKRKKINRRRVRKTPEPLSKLEVFYIAKHEMYKAARKAGFSESVALYLMDSPESMPDWVVGDKGIIPRIPTPDEDDD